MAPHARPLVDPGLRGHAAADPGRPGRAVLRAFACRLSNACGLRGGAAGGSGPVVVGAGLQPARAESASGGRGDESRPRRQGARGRSGLRALPGVGPYTARAVRSFAFGDDVAAVDTNGVRVLARAVAGAPLTVREAMALGDHLVPAGESWEFNQSMFDLGATVCTAARPDCGQCPLRRQCAWRRQRASTASPAPAPAPTRGGRAPRRAPEHLRRIGSSGQGPPAPCPAPGAVRRSDLAVACGWPEDRRAPNA